MSCGPDVYGSGEHLAFPVVSSMLQSCISALTFHHFLFTSTNKKNTLYSPTPKKASSYIRWYFTKYQRGKNLRRHNTVFDNVEIEHKRSWFIPHESSPQCTVQDGYRSLLSNMDKCSSVLNMWVKDGHFNILPPHPQGKGRRGCHAWVRHPWPVI